MTNLRIVPTVILDLLVTFISEHIRTTLLYIDHILESKFRDYRGSSRIHNLLLLSLLWWPTLRSFTGYDYLRKSLMAQWLRWASQGYEMHCPWSGGHGFEPWSGRAMGTWCFCLSRTFTQNILFQVVEKELLIQEKEKLYVELKHILARQPGPEVAEQLQIYQQTLREKTKQMKVCCLVNDLRCSCVRWLSFWCMKQNTRCDTCEIKWPWTSDVLNSHT